MLVILKGQLMDVVSSDYNYEGKTGTTYKALIYSGQTVHHVRLKAEEFVNFKQKIGQVVSVECTIFVNGKYTLTYQPTVATK